MKYVRRSNKHSQHIIPIEEIKTPIQGKYITFTISQRKNYQKTITNTLCQP